MNTREQLTYCAPASFPHTYDDGVSHHELLRQFVLDEVQALWAQCDGHGAPARMNRFSGEQAVDLVEDLLQLGAWVQQRSSELTQIRLWLNLFFTTAVNIEGTYLHQLCGPLQVRSLKPKY